ncbi:MAG: hypothetical protein LC104_10710 [Bacteroidales bacterium]|nr:hypothetical protein [Bacteroidales bacterium]
MKRTLAIVIALFLSTITVSAKDFPRPLSYAEAIGKDYIFVMLGPLEVDQAAAPGDAKLLADLRAKYPASGLYPAAGGLAVWTTDAPYVPSANAFASTDGVHMALIEGDWWKTKEYVSPRRLPEEKSQAQLHGPAVSFYVQGQLRKRYTVDQLIQEPNRLEHTPEHVLWAAGAALNDETMRFVVMTQDAQRITFDATTGEMLRRDPAGFGNPIASWIIAACGGLSLLVLAIWAWIVFLRRGKSVTASVTPSPS